MNSFELDLTEENLQLTQQLNKMHGAVMSRLRRLDDPQSPRAQLRALFRVCLPGERFAASDGIRVLYQGDGVTEKITVVEGERLNITVRVVAEKRNGGDKDGKTRDTRRPVRDDEAYEWASELLRKNGFELADGDVENPLLVSAASDAGAGRLRFRGREITAQVSVNDVGAVEAALNNGLGRGKNYGFGMIVLGSPS